MSKRNHYNHLNKAFNEEEVKEQQPAIQSDEIFQHLPKHDQGHGEDIDQDESDLISRPSDYQRSPMNDLITEKNYF